MNGTFWLVVQFLLQLLLNDGFFLVEKLVINLIELILISHIDIKSFYISKG